LKDPIAVICAAAAVLLIALNAIFFAARAALHVNPASVLREE
jgi:ABC-type lipoprotein release transport system permease subunit